MKASFTVRRNYMGYRLLLNDKEIVKTSTRGGQKLKDYARLAIKMCTALGIETELYDNTTVYIQPSKLKARRLKNANNARQKENTRLSELNRGCIERPDKTVLEPGEHQKR